VSASPRGIDSFSGGDTAAPAGPALGDDVPGGAAAGELVAGAFNAAPTAVALSATSRATGSLSAVPSARTLRSGFEGDTAFSVVVGAAGPVAVAVGAAAAVSAVVSGSEAVVSPFSVGS
jgi:hypothetical protein